MPLARSTSLRRSGQEEAVAAGPISCVTVKPGKCRHVPPPVSPLQALQLNGKARKKVFTLQRLFVSLQKAYKQRRGCWYILCRLKSYSENDLVFRKYFRAQWNQDLQWDAAGPRGKQERSKAFICNKLARLGWCSERWRRGCLFSHNSACVFPRLLEFPPTSYSMAENSSVLVHSSTLFH